MILSVTGYLAADPELKSVGDEGTKVCNFRIGHNRYVKGDEVTDWYSVAVWGKQGEACAEHLAKGRKVTVEGRLEPREFEDKEGATRMSLDVRAYQVEFHGGGDAPTEKAATSDKKPGDDQALDF